MSILLGGTSCSDFLDQPILGKNVDTPEYYDDIENARLALGGCYYSLVYHTKYCAFRWVYGDVRSDDAWKGGGGPGDGVDIQRIKEWTILPTEDYIGSSWSASYVAIYAANTLIEKLDKVTFDEQLKKQFIAEAKFIRAYSYFILVNLFGDAPLFTKPVDVNKIGSIERTPFEVVLEQIEKDLNEAAEDLPERYPAEEAGRITWGAAKALHAKVAMYGIGIFKSKPESAWQQVYDLADEVIKSKNYNLHPNYAEIFEQEGENCSESIFELQFKRTNTGWLWGNQGNPGDVFVASRGTDDFPSWGWGFNCPTQDLVDEFEQNDPRLYTTVHGRGITDYLYGVKHEVGQQAYLTGYAARKMAVDPAFRPSEHSDGPTNVRIIRYADVVLMKAEAAYHLNKESEARELINQVRRRARTSTYPKGYEKDENIYTPTGFTNNLPDLSSAVQGEALLKALKHERRVEFGMEGSRYWDLVRWGEYRDILSDEVKARFDKRQLRGVPVLPIPDGEVVSWGLEQNPR